MPYVPSTAQPNTRNALLEYIERKHKAGKAKAIPEKPEEAAEAGEVIDLMDALKKSVERSKKGRERKPAAAAADGRWKKGKAAA